MAYSTQLLITYCSLAKCLTQSTSWQDYFFFFLKVLWLWFVNMLFFPPKCIQSTVWKVKHLNLMLATSFLSKKYSIKLQCMHILECRYLHYRDFKDMNEVYLNSVHCVSFQWRCLHNAYSIPSSRGQDKSAYWAELRESAQGFI